MAEKTGCQGELNSPVAEEPELWPHLLSREIVGRQEGLKFLDALRHGSICCAEFPSYSGRRFPCEFKSSPKAPPLQLLSPCSRASGLWPLRWDSLSMCFAFVARILL